MRTLITVLALLAVGCAPQQSQPEAATPAGTGKPLAAPAAPGKPPAARPRTLTLAAGTDLKVRTTSAISTKTHQSGDKFEATLEEPLVEGDQVIAVKGALVEGRIAEADQGGRVKGKATLAVRLTRLHAAGGQVVDIETNTLGREAKETHKQDAAKIGIGAGVGAAIGAIAGGGKGAAVGAASGAGAGTGLVLATRGGAATIPSETVLRFQLRAPVTIGR